MQVLGYDNVFLPVGDLNEAIHFYCDVLGLPVARRFEEMGTVLFDIGEETPGLGIAASDHPDVGDQKVWFEVPDAREAADELADFGIVPTTPAVLIPTGWAFEIRDPWGNLLGFTDYTARPELGRC